jgi:hypothetical protein
MDSWIHAVLPAPSALLAIGAVLFWKHKRQRSVVLRGVTALGLVGLCCLPSALVQVFLAARGQSPTSFAGTELVPVFLVGWWVLSGGASVIALFEASAEAISGHRSATLLDNLPWYWVLLALQWGILVTLLLPHFGARFRWSSPRLWLIGGAVALNSALGIQWPWWGT